jgi:hypothetical protein
LLEAVVEQELIEEAVVELEAIYAPQLIYVVIHLIPQ